MRKPVSWKYRLSGCARTDPTVGKMLPLPMTSATSTSDTILATGRPVDQGLVTRINNPSRWGCHDVAGMVRRFGQNCPALQKIQSNRRDSRMVERGAGLTVALQSPGRPLAGESRVEL